MKLYELKAEYEQLMEKIEQYAYENEGLIPDNIDAMLSEIEEDHHDKMVSCACLVKNLESDSLALKKEEDALASRRRAISKRADAVKKYMSAYAIEGEKINDPRAVISCRESTATEIINENLIPQDYHKISVSYDKTAIKKAIKAGVEVPGALIVKKQNLQIK